MKYSNEFDKSLVEEIDKLKGVKKHDTSNDYVLPPIDNAYCNAFNNCGTLSTHFISDYYNSDDTSDYIQRLANAINENDYQALPNVMTDDTLRSLEQYVTTTHNWR